MTLKRWLFVAVAMALTLTASIAPAQTSPCWDLPDPLVQRTYWVADLIVGVGTESTHQDELMKTITQVVEPKSWQEHGGRGTIDYYPPLGMELIVLQTAEVHERLNVYLAALRHFGTQQARNARPSSFPAAPCCLQACCAAAPPSAASSACACPQCGKGVDGACSCPNCKGCDSCNCGKSKGCDSCDKPAAAHTHPKQYGHFVMENVTINAMGVSAKIKRIRVMYKGDGIDNDVAKCAVTNGESEKKVDGAKLDTLLEKLSELLEKKPSTTMAAPCCLPASAIGAAMGALTGATMAPAPPPPANAGCGIPPGSWSAVIPACVPPLPAPAASISTAVVPAAAATAKYATPMPVAAPAPAPAKPMPVANDDEDE